MRPAASQLPAPIVWHVWKKSDPSIFVEVTEQFWLDARCKGACEISAMIDAAVFFEEIEAVPASSNMVHLEVERMRRAMLRNPPVVRRLR